MKYLSNYMEAKQTELFKRYGVIFAFGEKQFKESATLCVNYVYMCSGMYAPKIHAKAVEDALSEIYRKSIQEDIEENGKAKIIQRELQNYECYYVSDISDAVAALVDYGYTQKDVMRVYKKNYNNAFED